MIAKAAFRPLCISSLGRVMGFEPTIFWTTTRRFKPLSYTRLNLEILAHYPCFFLVLRASMSGRINAHDKIAPVLFATKSRQVS